MCCRPKENRLMNEPVRVQKLKPTGEVVIEWSGRVLERDVHGLTLEARFTRKTMALGYVTMATGDRFVETYYTDRWYNVFAIYAGDSGEFKGWYCNISRPTEIIEPARPGEAVLVRTVDLALDYFRQPGGREFVLDEDEFAELSLPPEEAAAARAALEEVRAAAGAGLGPFARRLGGP
jgi:predicted RNA-binding protein associated with RNAse of E/G family